MANSFTVVIPLWQPLPDAISISNRFKKQTVRVFELTVLPEILNLAAVHKINFLGPAILAINNAGPV